MKTGLHESFWSLVLLQFEIFLIDFKSFCKFVYCLFPLNRNFVGEMWLNQFQNAKIFFVYSKCLYKLAVVLWGWNTYNPVSHSSAFICMTNLVWQKKILDCQDKSGQLYSVLRGGCLVQLSICFKLLNKFNLVYSIH